MPGLEVGFSERVARRMDVQAGWACRQGRGGSWLVRGPEAGAALEQREAGEQPPGPSALSWCGGPACPLAAPVSPTPPPRVPPQSVRLGPCPLSVRIRDLTASYLASRNGPARQRDLDSGPRLPLSDLESPCLGAWIPGSGWSWCSPFSVCGPPGKAQGPCGGTPFPAPCLRWARAGHPSSLLLRTAHSAPRRTS